MGPGFYVTSLLESYGFKIMGSTGLSYSVHVGQHTLGAEYAHQADSPGKTTFCKLPSLMHELHK